MEFGAECAAKMGLTVKTAFKGNAANVLVAVTLLRQQLKAPLQTAIPKIICDPAMRGKNAIDMCS